MSYNLKIFSRVSIKNRFYVITKKMYYYKSLIIAKLHNLISMK